MGIILAHNVNQHFNSIDDRNPENHSGLDSGICFGTIQGMRNMNSFYAVKLSKKQLFFCVPVKATTGQLSRVIVKYSENNPEILHEPESALILRAFIDAYPCP